MWQIGGLYSFLPSGDADELIIKIVRRASEAEAERWWRKTYQRPVQCSSRVYRAVVVKRGFDGDVEHRPGEPYYVYDSEFKDAKLILS